jgi:outer membrane protein TolC
VNANQRTVDPANELYAKGLSDFLNVLKSQRAKYLTEDQFAQSRLFNEIACHSRFLEVTHIMYY